MKSILEIATFLKKRGEVLKSVPQNGIDAIEKKYGITLPEVYKFFLNLMGNGAGSYMKGSSVFYEEIFSLKEWAAELIEENNLESLPNDAFVFWMHQGYQAAYFKLSDGDDPPVYYFTEGANNKGFEISKKTLTDFFLSQLVTFPNGS